MPSLFIVMLGGRHIRANTEVHDVVLAVGETLEETYAQLRAAWFGEQKGLHIDAWAKINGVQFAGKRYQIHFSNAAPGLNDDKLYLLNLGGYLAHEFGELHRYKLVVAQNAMRARQSAQDGFIQHWQKQHIDAVLEVDDCIAIDQIYGRYVQLIPGEFAGNCWENTYLILP